MEFVAENLAAFIQTSRSAQSVSLRIVEKEINGLGDIARITSLSACDPGPDVAGQYERINRSEVEDPNVQLQEPCWGEIAK
jgi:hypothetical protein